MTLHYGFLFTMVLFNLTLRFSLSKTGSPLVYKIISKLQKSSLHISLHYHVFLLYFFIQCWLPQSYTQKYDKSASEVEILAANSKCIRSAK